MEIAESIAQTIDFSKLRSRSHALQTNEVLMYIEIYANLGQ